MGHHKCIFVFLMIFLVASIICKDIPVQQNQVKKEKEKEKVKAGGDKTDLPLSDNNGKSEFTASDLLKMFSIIWVVPKSHCDTISINLNIDGTGIEDHWQSSPFPGAGVVVFYTLGVWPYIYDTSESNVGIPQVANLTLHFEEVIADVERQIPDKSYSGIAVIDFEAWRANWEQNFSALRKYQYRSIDYVQQRYPELNSEEKIKQAIREFNSAARAIMEGTIQIARSVRPYAQWSYYSYPMCFNYDEGTTTCHEAHRGQNDETQWLYQASDLLTPSIYLVYHDGYPDQTAHVYGKVEEALRVAGNSYGPRIPVIPFSSIHYHSQYTHFYTRDDLYTSLLLPADMGAAGVILWGSWGSANDRDKCEAVADYVKNVLGKVAKEVIDSKRACAIQRCSGHGRCVHRDVFPSLRERNDPNLHRGNFSEEGSRWRYLVDYKVNRWNSTRLRALTPGYKFSKDEDYNCVCYDGYSGVDCGEEHKSGK